MSSHTDAPPGALSEINGPDPSRVPSTGGAASVRAARASRAPEGRAHGRWPSLASRARGWTWRTDPDDVLVPGDDRHRSSSTDPQVVRAVAWSRILIG